MARTLEFTDQSLILHLSGLTSAAALKRKIEISYSSIKKVTVEDFQVALLSFRVGTSAFDIREGRFYTHNDWCFVSYENHNDVVVLDLTDHDYGKVVFQVEDPKDASEEILSRMKREQ